MAAPEPLSEPQQEPAVDSIYKGGGRSAEQSRSAKDLIEIEWKIVEKLIRMTESTRSEKTQAFYYQTLAGHIRTLSMLLKIHGQPDQSQDLAKILSEITKEARTLCKRLKQK
jgi:hypothetical protein